MRALEPIVQSLKKCGRAACVDVTAEDGRILACEEVLCLLQEMGLPVGLKGSWLELVQEVEWLDEGVIGQYSRCSDAIEVRALVDSTNRILMEEGSGNSSHVRIMFAEGQYAGVGSQGRRWYSPIANHLYVSAVVERHIDKVNMAGFALRAGLALHAGLAGAGLNGHCCKWPNDILLEGRKLAGVLVQSRIMGQQLRLVVGIGLNYSADARMHQVLERSVVGLGDCLPGLSRSRVAAMLVDVLYDIMQDQLDAALDVGRWKVVDCHAGKMVEWRAADGERCAGRVLGVDETGRVVIDAPAGVRHFAAGEISLRMG